MFSTEYFKRDNLAEFISNPRTLRAFEDLNETVSANTDEIKDALIEAIVASANARAAIAIAEDLILKLTGGVNLNPAVLSLPLQSQNLEAKTELGSMAAQSARKVKITGGEVTAKLKNTIAAVMLENTVSLTDGAASNVATITNSPVAGNPTKWIPIVDGGITRYIPAW